MKRFKWVAILAIVGVAAGIVISLLVARQKAQARFIEAAREADSLSFVAMALQEQIKAIVGLGEYKPDTLWMPPEIDTLIRRIPYPETLLVPEIVGTVSFDTTKDFKYGGWEFGVRAKGRFFCEEEYKHLNRLELYPTYWKRPPPVKDILEIDTNLLQSFGFGIAAINTAVGLSGRYNRTTIMIMRDLRRGGGWRLGGNVEFWRF